MVIIIQILISSVNNVPVIVWHAVLIPFAWPARISSIYKRTNVWTIVHLVNIKPQILLPVKVAALTAKLVSLYLIVYLVMIITFCWITNVISVIPPVSLVPELRLTNVSLVPLMLIWRMGSVSPVMQVVSLAQEPPRLNVWLVLLENSYQFHYLY